MRAATAAKLKATRVRTPAGRHDMEVRNLLEFSPPSETSNRQLKTILLTAPYNGNGATTCSLALANALRAHCGESVLVIDGNPKTPTLHDIFDAPLSPGFRSLIEGFPRAADCIYESEAGFDGMPAGETNRERSVHDLRDRTRLILDTLAATYRYILVDGMAIQTNPEVLAMSAAFDGVILVVESESTQWSIGAAIKEKLDRSGAHLIGAMLNKRRLYLPQWIYDRL